MVSNVVFIKNIDNAIKKLKHINQQNLAKYNFKNKHPLERKKIVEKEMSYQKRTPKSKNESYKKVTKEKQLKPTKKVK
jgi:hypothetical protein